MDFKQQRSLQLAVFDYFKDISDELFSQIVDSFVYNKGSSNDEVGKIMTKFLKDNGVEQAYINYRIDLTNEAKFFKRSSMTESDMIEQLRTAFLNVGFHRFQNNLKLLKDAAEMKRIINVLMDAGTTDNFHDALDDAKRLYLKWNK